ncbi:MAG: CBS domain-containing protein, partial [Marinosulfonomonas sp.]|nr:CBS domain-containing protein [Marinosulfonomonas sp.]
RALVRGILWIFGVRIDPASHILAVREEIAGVISLGHVEGAVQKEDRDRLLGALDLGERDVEEIMRHRSEIEMIDASMAPQKIIEIVLQSAHTRLPVFHGDPENIVGVLHSKDMLRAAYARSQTNAESFNAFEAFSVLDVAMKPYFIPETTPLDDQMHEFLRRKTHFALVVDEYGALQGLITLEDILEEIVGEITDEFDPEEHHDLKLSDTGDLTVDGAMTIRDLNRATDWNLPDEEANTIAGLVIHEAQTIPLAGQVFSFHNFRIEVVERKANRVTKLKIRPL